MSYWNKKGQAESETFRYLAISLVSILVLYFGYTFVSGFIARGCQSDLAIFESKLKADIQTYSSQVGKITEMPIDGLCDAEKLLLLDLDKTATLDVSSHNFLPVIKNSINARQKVNAFIIKDNEVVRSFFAGPLELSNPPYTCVRMRSDKAKVTYRGRGTGLQVDPSDYRYSCTFEEVTLRLEGEDTEKLMDDVPETANPPNLPAVETPEFYNLNRKFDSKDDKTVVKVAKADKADKVESFKLLENIPKCAVEGLEEAIDKQVITGISKSQIQIIKDDPIFVWEFEDNDKENEYTINKIIDEGCKRDFKSRVYREPETNLLPPDPINQPVQIGTSPGEGRPGDPLTNPPTPPPAVTSGNGDSLAGKYQQLETMNAGLLTGSTGSTKGIGRKASTKIQSAKAEILEQKDCSANPSLSCPAGTSHYELKTNDLKENVKDSNEKLEEAKNEYNKLPDPTSGDPSSAMKQTLISQVDAIIAEQNQLAGTST